MSNINCEHCTNCNNCYYCYYCYYCNNCNTCNNCNNCNNCYYCYYCDNCDNCYYCDDCYYCSNIKMTEYNIFCYAEKYNDENSFQQPRYRVFNKQLSKEEYEKIRANLPKIKLEFDTKVSHDKRYKEARSRVIEEDIRKCMEIPYFDAEIFEKITGIDVSKLGTMSGKKVKVIVDGKEYDAVIE